MRHPFSRASKGPALAAVAAGAVMLLSLAATPASATTPNLDTPADNAIYGPIEDTGLTAWEQPDNQDHDTWCCDGNFAEVQSRKTIAINVGEQSLVARARPDGALATVPRSSFGKSPATEHTFSLPTTAGQLHLNKGSLLLDTSSLPADETNPAKRPNHQRLSLTALQTVPEPSSILLGAIGLTIMVITRRRVR